MGAAGHRVLFMDDDEGICDIVSVFLRSLGYRVEVAKDGGRAIEQYRKAVQEGDPFRVVVLDLSVKAGMGGIETLQELKAVDPGVKAVITTGFTGDPICSSYRGYGFVAVLPKPFEVRELDGVLRETISEDSNQGGM